MITSTSNSKIKQLVQWNQKARARKEDRVFLAEGIKMFQEAPKAWIREVFLTEELMKRLSQPLLEKLNGLPFETVSEEVFKKAADTQSPQGILCVLHQPEYGLQDLGIYRQDALLMVLEDLQDPGNLGTILRTGEGAGVTGVLMSRRTVDLFNPKTIRATMGSIYRMPFLYVDSLEQAVRQLQQNGVQVYAAHLEGKTEHYQENYKGKTAFLIGNEGNGLKPETAALADTYIRIPMEGQVESLNAAIASAILMYEAARQRKETER